MIKNELLFIGPPASGKGTQTFRLSNEKEMVHVDTGSLLREAIALGTEDGIKAKSFIDKGQLAPSEVVAQIIKSRLMKKDCQKGFILDGYPRSIEQAEYFTKIQKDLENHFDDDANVKMHVFYFDIPLNDLMDRIVYRRSCPKCGAIYNLKFMPPKNVNICDKCNSDLQQRKDDTEEVAKARFETYFKQTAPLVEYYEKQGVLRRIDARGSVEEVYQRVLDVLKNGNL